MDWTARLNKVMDYVEENIHGEIAEEEISRITACPYTMFQSSFSQIVGIPFSEYVRRRRLTMAAYELLNTNRKIIDIAMDYGYQSDDAFRVAFKNLHGINPAEVRKANPPLVFYCRLDFEINIKGVDKMNYSVVEKDAFQVIGIRRITPYGGGTWAIVKSDGSNDRIRDLTGSFFDLGLCFGFDEKGNNDYMCAIECSDYQGDEYSAYQYPAATWLKFEAKGKISDNTLGSVWQQINNEFLPSSKFHKGPLPTIEKYVLWNDAEDICLVEIWIPQ
ncbi:AraC family transcriptional regulator [Eisenbergiella tayi]|uniref:AraC family transcriptional regulator n=1 Tax=Eisenbergiella tayi TaxID=1432052 RepID=UPI002082256A|nr:putative HTH-type transcriptional regulator YdeE [Lachnospiraceae bacterium]